MSYLMQNNVAASMTMRGRVAACVAEQMELHPDADLNGNTNADSWAYLYQREWAAAPGWAAAWEYALLTHDPKPDEPTYDPGADEAVITDGMILSQIQLMLGIGGPKEESSAT